MSFVHLHTHSHYSLLDGMSRIEGMLEIAKATGMPAIGLTDHGNLYGAIEFYKACTAAGIKPIIGVEAYIANRTRFDKQPGIDATRHHLTLLATSERGYRNLLKLVTRSFLEGYYYKPRMDKELLRQFKDDIICLSGCLGGELCGALWNNDEKRAREIVAEYRDIFGADNYFIEVMHHPGLERFDEIRAKLIALSRETGVPLVATQDSHYLYKEDAEAHDTLLAIQTNTDIEDGKRLTLKDDDFSFVTPEVARERFADIPEAIENTLKIAERCDIKLKLGSWVFPNLSLPDGTTYDKELRRLTYEGIPRRCLSETPEVVNRVEYELEIIKNKGFSAYMLIVADILRFAHENNILTNIRGSVAGSLVTYLLFITSVNPLEYKLPFERFLNPERPSAPDIDMDFADNRRDEVIQYAREKYGADHVAQIGTFGTMLARGSVRDVARALKYPYAVGDRISRLIPMGSQGFPMTIDRALEMTPELREMYEKEADTKRIIDMAKKIEGLVRHISVHAAGVVMSPTPVDDFVPLQLDPRGGKIITQFDMHAVEDAGLIKFDFLGIRNLAILGDAVRLVKKFRTVNVDLDSLPLDEEKTFGLLARGDTMGLFQLNGAGMTRYLKELRPTTIHDINAMVALYRPGPIENIPEYIRRKQNPALITYLDPRLKNILDASYGMIVYQDDVLLTAINLAGYSWLEADKLRKAMGKKIPAEMEAQKEKLKKGFVEHGLSSEKADNLWKLIEPFAAYGFNKAHAASYGRVAYQTAYMKANYPTEYMCAILTAESGDTEKISEAITECKRMNIPVLPPDINESFGNFTVIAGGEEEKIRVGLYTIKNLGVEIANAIINEREEHGRFRSFSDFLDRVKHRNLNKKSLEALIMSGTMDDFGERGQLVANSDDALTYNREGSKNGGQSSLFGLMENTASVPELTLKPAEPASQTQKLAWEKELLGLYLSGHPLEKFKDRIAAHGKSVPEAKTLADNLPVVIGGLVEEVKIITTKKGDQMAFVKLADMSDSIETVVFNGIYEENKALLVAGACVAVKGKLSRRNGEPSIVVDRIKKLE